MGLGKEGIDPQALDTRCVHILSGSNLLDELLKNRELLRRLGKTEGLEKSEFLYVRNILADLGDAGSVSGDLAASHLNTNLWGVEAWLRSVLDVWRVEGLNVGLGWGSVVGNRLGWGRLGLFV